MCKEAYENLLNAVVLQAVKDYMEGGEYARDAKAFLKSDRVSCFTKVNGQAILNKLDDLKEGNVR